MDGFEVDVLRDVSTAVFRTTNAKASDVAWINLLVILLGEMGLAPPLCGDCHALIARRRCHAFSGVPGQRAA